MARLMFPTNSRSDRVGDLPPVRRGPWVQAAWLTVAEETLQGASWPNTAKSVATHLFGQEINSETYAICKADLLLKGDGEAADNVVGGPEYSTLSNDAFLVP